jgi:oligoribonuclease NrnB/cAMP/cGMP phosphodiesterase (DHH superfamily)
MLIISHARDIDGIFSAALAIRKAKKENENYSLILIDYPEYDLLIDKIKNSGEERIIILDIGVNDNKVKELIEALKSSKSFIIWVDHHVWENSTIKEVSKYCNLVIGNNSATFLFSRIFSKDSFSRKLAKVADDSDFFINKLKISKKLSLIITYFNAFSKEKLYWLAEYFSENTRLSKDMEELAEKIEKEIEEARKEVEKKLEIIEIQKKRIGLVELSKILNPSFEGDRLIKEKNLNTCIMLFKNENGYSVSIRGEKALELAKLLGGGGHPNAAGASIAYNDVEKIKQNLLVVFGSKFS